MQVSQPPAPYNDADALAAAIIQQWATEAEADGSRFVVVHLPMKNAVQAYQSGQALDYEPLRSDVSSRYEWIETLDAFPRRRERAVRARRALLAAGQRDDCHRHRRLPRRSPLAFVSPSPHRWG